MRKALFVAFCAVIVVFTAGNAEAGHGGSHRYSNHGGGCHGGGHHRGHGDSVWTVVGAVAAMETIHVIAENARDREVVVESAPRRVYVERKYESYAEYTPRVGKNGPAHVKLGEYFDSPESFPNGAIVYKNVNCKRVKIGWLPEGTEIDAGTAVVQKPNGDIVLRPF